MTLGCLINFNKMEKKMKKILTIIVMLFSVKTNAQNICKGERIHFPYFIKTQSLTTREVGKKLSIELNKLYDPSQHYPYIVISKVKFNEINKEVKEFTDSAATYYKLWVNNCKNGNSAESHFLTNGFIVLNNDVLTSSKEEFARLEMEHKIPVIFNEYDQVFFYTHENKTENNNSKLFIPFPQDNKYVYICFHQGKRKGKYSIINYYNYQKSKE